MFNSDPHFGMMSIPFGFFLIVAFIGALFLTVH